jgi:hypothetical protein
MKRPIFPVIRLKIWLCLLWACLSQNITLAQNGITVYSDTVSALEDVADDSTWNAPPSVYSHTFSLTEDLGNEGILDFLSGLLGIGGVLLTVLTVILFLIPVLLVLLAVYLIYRSHREKNMRIFLTAINAKYIHSNLAVYSLRAYAKDYQDQIVIGEYTINNRVDYILEQIYKAKPDVLCFSCYIWNMDYVEELITEYHKLCPEVPIWVGGPEVSYEVETFLAEHPQVTGVMIGEGERTFKQLCKYYVNRAGSLEEIRGIAFRDQDSGKTIFTPVQEPMKP